MEQDKYILIYILSCIFISLIVCSYRGLYKNDGEYAAALYLVVTMTGWIILPLIPVIAAIAGICYIIRNIELFIIKIKNNHGSSNKTNSKRDSASNC